MTLVAAWKARKEWLTSAFFGVGALVLLLITAGSIGVTWDEPIYSQAAENVARWFGLLLREGPARAWEPTAFGIGWGLVNEHPPLVRVVNGLGWALTRGFLPPPASHRAGSMALAAAGLGLLVAAAGQHRGLWAGIFAAAALLGMPRPFFHAHLGALDFPHAMTWLLATLMFYRAIRQPRWWAPLFIGGGLGLALLTKISALLLVPFWGLWLVIYRRNRYSLLAFVSGLPVAMLVLIAGWPWIWQDPLGGLIRWVEFFHNHFEIRQWFAGRLYVTTPWHLPLAMVAITTPLPLLALALIGTLESRPQIAARRPPFHISEWTGLHLLGLSVVLGYYMLPITAIHDQERLLMPAFVHLAVLAGNGFIVLAHALEKFGSRAWEYLHTLTKLVPLPLPATGHLALARHVLFGVLASLLLLPGVLGIARLHPFELSYYNGMVGGLQGAARLGMETTYFASTYGYFLSYLNRLPAGSRLWVMPNSWDVIYYYQLNGLLRRDLVVLRPWGWGSFYDDQGVLWEVGGLEQADFALIDRRQTTFNDVIPEYAIQLRWAASKPEVARLEREGLLLAALYAR